MGRFFSKKIGNTGPIFKMGVSYKTKDVYMENDPFAEIYSLTLFFICNTILKIGPVLPIFLGKMGPNVTYVLPNFEILNFVKIH